MFRETALVAAGVAILVAASSHAQAQSDNALRQFNTKHNPNGQWSYLAGGALLDKTIACDGAAKFECWWNGGSIPNSAVVGGNKTGTTQSYYTIVLPKGYMTLDPEDLGDVTVRWTAAVAGQVSIKGNFLGVDTSEVSHAVAVLHNATALKSGTISQYQQKISFNTTIAVAAGDTISFVSYSNSAYYLSTGLQATITAQ